MSALLSDPTLLMIVGLLIAVFVLRVVAKLACLAVTIVLVLGVLGILGFNLF